MDELRSPIVIDTTQEASFTFGNAPDAQSDDQERLDALASAGLLKVNGKLNIVARALKPRYLTKDGDNVRVDQHLIDTLITPFVYFDEDTRKLSVRFAFTAACLARWFCTIGEAGVFLYPDSEPEDIARAINAAILSADLPMFTITPHDFLLPDELTL